MRQWVAFGKLITLDGRHGVSGRRSSSSISSSSSSSYSRSSSISSSRGSSSSSSSMALYHEVWYIKLAISFFMYRIIPYAIQSCRFGLIPQRRRQPVTHLCHPFHSGGSIGGDGGDRPPPLTGWNFFFLKFKLFIIEKIIFCYNISCMLTWVICEVSDNQNER